MDHFVYSDGGRASAGFKGTAGDCAVRAIAIATGLPYTEAYEIVRKHCKQEKASKSRRGISSPRDGVHAVTMQAIMADLGWRWVPLVGIGTGCTVRACPTELPRGRVVLRLSKHYAASLDGVVHDAYDSTRDGSRCVYGYWTQSRKAH